MPIHLSTTGPVATVTIERPHRRNALDLETLDDLHHSVVEALAEGARAILLTGADGPFCSGADLVLGSHR